MTLINLIFSLVLSVDLSDKTHKYRAPSPGFMVSAAIDMSRILGLPFIRNQNKLTSEEKHDDVIWIMAEVIGPEEPIPRRKRFIQELVYSNRITNFLKY